MKKQSMYVAILAAGMLMSCGGSSDSKTEQGSATEQSAVAPLTLESLMDTDLNSQGLPIIIKAPKDAKLKKNSEGTEVVVDGGENFKIEVHTFKSSDFAESVATQKDMVSDTSLYPSFDKFEINDPEGYVKVSKSGEKTFYFAVKNNKGDGYFSIKGDMMGSFSPEAVDLMYKAAKLAKATDTK